MRIEQLTLASSLLVYGKNVLVVVNACDVKRTLEAIKKNVNNYGVNPHHGDYHVDITRENIIYMNDSYVRVIAYSPMPRITGMRVDEIIIDDNIRQKVNADKKLKNELADISSKCFKESQELKSLRAITDAYEKNLNDDKILYSDSMNRLKKEIKEHYRFK